MADQAPFHRFLLRSAFCVMACDGHIDDREVAEVKKLAETTPYFGDVDVGEEVRALREALNEEGSRTFRHYLADLDEQSLDGVQELILLEIVLRMIYIDVKIDTNEMTFARLIRSKLAVSNEILAQRFGTVELFREEEKVSSLTGVFGSESGSAVFPNHADEAFKSLDVDWGD